MKLFVLDRKKGKKVFAGLVSGHLFQRTVKATHLHRLTNSYGMNVEVAQKLLKMGVTDVHLVQDWDGRVLGSKLSDWFAPDVRVIDWGSGPQRFLPVQRMRYVDTTSSDREWQKELDKHHGELKAAVMSPEQYAAFVAKEERNG